MASMIPARLATQMLRTTRPSGTRRFLTSYGVMRRSVLGSSPASTVRYVLPSSLGGPPQAAGRNSVAGFTRCMSDTPEELEEREAMEFDVVIVGAGPAGLSAAIRLKQRAADHGKEVSVCVLEKGAEVGLHILSGNVFEPHALNELIPDWKDKGAPLETEAKEDSFFFLTGPKGGTQVPNALLPRSLDNHGNYIISLGALTKWLAEQAEELGVEIYPGFAADEVLYEDGAVAGVATKDAGVGKDGVRKDTFARGMELRARQTLFAEGCRGSCSEDVIAKFGLREGKDMQTYGIGMKEVWEIPEDKHRPGLIQHSIGWPLDTQTYGGSFLYHMKPNKVLIGFVVGLDYKNPFLSPYQEFQRWKTNPVIAKHLEGGTCVSYGARALNEGGLQAIPKLTFPGGALLGCSAGFVNVPKIKGSHTAMKSGMLAAEQVFAALEAQSQDEWIGSGAEISSLPSVEVEGYQNAMENSWVWKELNEVRNVHPAFHWGLYAGLAYSGVALHLFKGAEPWTFRNKSKGDHTTTEPASKHQEITYPKPDGVLTFDILTNLARASVNHEGDQPSHLTIKPELADWPAAKSVQEFAGPEGRFCPARVYEWHKDDKGNPQLVINAQNCVHCKTCDIKTPGNYIKWKVPEGGGGPAYQGM